VFIVKEIEVFEFADETILSANREKYVWMSVYFKRLPRGEPDVFSRQLLRARWAQAAQSNANGWERSAKPGSICNNLSWRTSSPDRWGQERKFRCKMTSKEENERLVRSRRRYVQKLREKDK
jgi:hypothetical protein